MKYIIGYDLRKPNRDYENIKETLEQLGAIKVLQSQWMLNCSKDIDELFDIISKEIDDDDGILIVSLGRITNVRIGRIPRKITKRINSIMQ